jgi:hypothetical protein
MAALSLDATKLAFSRSASEQSKALSLPKAKPEEFFPSFSAEMVETTGTTIHVFYEKVPVDRCCSCTGIPKPT